MKEVISYECSVCGRIYKSVELANRCEDMHSDRYSKEYIVEDLDDNKRELTVCYNYENLSKIVKYKDRYLLGIEGECICMDNDKIDELINALQSIKKDYISENILRKSRRKNV